MVLIRLNRETIQVLVNRRNITLDLVLMSHNNQPIAIRKLSNKNPNGRELYRHTTYFIKKFVNKYWKNGVTNQIMNSDRRAHRRKEEDHEDQTTEERPLTILLALQT